MVILIGIILVICIISLLSSMSQRVHMFDRGVALNKRFNKLGRVTGLTIRQVTDAVGPPTAVTHASANQIIMQWQEIGYHIVLVFDGGICEGVSHEYASST